MSTLLVLVVLFLQLLTADTLPLAFDWCDQGWCTPTWNQYSPRYCGSCWIHAALSAVSDRIRGYQRGRGPSVLLSRQEILDCGEIKHLGSGCHGGDGTDAYEYMKKFGLPTETCNAYIARSRHSCDAMSHCFDCRPLYGKTECVPVKKKHYHRYYISDYYEVKGEEAMMKEIFAWGPISCGVALSEEWYTYDGGIFDDPRPHPSIGHDVEIVGWGVDPITKVKYWRGKNSQGDFWGEDGFFRIKRGEDNARIESLCVAATLDVNRTTAPLRRVASFSSTSLSDAQTLMSQTSTQVNSRLIYLLPLLIITFLLLPLISKSCRRCGEYIQNKKTTCEREREEGVYGSL